MDISTERLVLRRPIETDFSAMAVMRRDPSINQYIPRPPEDIDSAVQKLIADMATHKIGDDGWYLLVVEERNGAGILGEIIFKFQKGKRLQAELGYRFVEQAQGRGYAREAVTAALDCLFLDQGYHRVFALTDTRNLASIRLLTRLGFRQEGHFKQSFDARDGWADDYAFAILAEEWRGNKERGQ